MFEDVIGILLQKKGELSAEEYAEAKEQRRQWRAEINALETRL